MSTTSEAPEPGTVEVSLGRVFQALPEDFFLLHELTVRFNRELREDVLVSNNALECAVAGAFLRKVQRDLQDLASGPIDYAARQHEDRLGEYASTITDILFSTDEGEEGDDDDC